MRQILTISALLAPGAALADPGHLAEVAGHSHWVAAGALAAAAALGLLAWGKRGGGEAADKDEAAEAGDEKEATA